MLDHVMEVVLYALRIRRSYLLPSGAEPEDQAKQSEVWTALCCYGALIHDLGKLATDIEVELKSGHRWTPFEGEISEPYRFRFIKKRDPYLHETAGGTLMTKVIPPEIMGWIARYPEAFNALIELSAGHYDKAGALGEIVSKADRLSVKLNIGANPDQIANAPIQSLQRQLLDGLKHLVKNELKLNRPGAQGWLTEDALWLISKTTADTLRAHLYQKGYTSVPSNNLVLFDELQSHGIVEQNESGKAIWSAEVIDGDWQQRLTFLKIRPSLIWGNEEPPERFGGSVKVAPLATTENPRETIGTPQAVEPPTKTHIENKDKSLEISTLNQEEKISIRCSNEAHKNIQKQKTNEDFVTANVAKTTQPITPLSHEEVLTRRQKAEGLMAWINEGVLTGRLTINERTSLLHIVNTQWFVVTPGIFKRYSLETMGTDAKEEWIKVQRGFEKLNVHIKQPNDLNIWSCEVFGERKSGKIITGYLLSGNVIKPDRYPSDNPHLSIIRQA
jgi:hypothetical protein